MTSISSVGPGQISASDPKARAAAPRMTFSSGRGGFLVQHFGMTGGLKYFMDMEKDNPHDRLLVSFSNGYHLAYDCQRKCGKIGLVEDLAA